MNLPRVAEITSAQNARIKAARRLQSARRRRETGLTLVESRRLLEAALANGVAIAELFVTDPADELVEYADSVAIVPDEVLRRVATTQHPQDVVGVVEWAPAREIPEDAVRLLVLDRVGDPGNAGTLIRTAAAFGCDSIVLTRGSCDPANPKVVRASGGAVFVATIVAGPHSDDTIDALRERGIPTLAAAAHVAGPPEDIGDSWALVLGSEAHGLDDAVLRRADRVVSVPMAGAVESLNAAAAGAVLLYILTAGQ